MTRPYSVNEDSNSNETVSHPNGANSPSNENGDLPRKRKRHPARPLQLPRDRLAITFRQCRERAGLSLSQLADRSGVDVAHIWRIEQGEHQNVSREILILLSIALVLGSESVDLIVEVANEILDAAGLKMLRSPRESSSPSSTANTLRGQNGSDNWR